MGMPPPEPGQHSTIPPRPHGGNLDCRELVAGSTLYLPIPVDGCLVSVGDGHAAQGDGEVGGTAIECRMERVDITFSVHDDVPISLPFAETPAGLLTIGLGSTVDEATFGALDAMFELLGRRHGLSRPDAIALSSVAVDVRVTQIVNETVGVHALLRPDALLIAARPDPGVGTRRGAGSGRGRPVSAARGRCRRRGRRAAGVGGARPVAGDSPGGSTGRGSAGSHAVSALVGSLARGESHSTEELGCRPGSWPLVGR